MRRKMKTKNNCNPKKVSARRAKRARHFKGKELERICNKAALKFDSRITSHQRAAREVAPELASEILRSTSRRYMIKPGTDEHDLLKTALEARAQRYRVDYASL